MRRLFALLLTLSLLTLTIVPATAQDQDMVTIGDIVVEQASADDAEFTTLLAAIEAADPAFLAQLTDPEADVTVFAPTDAAFADLLEGMALAPEDLLADTALLNDVLAYHVVPASFPAETILELDGALLGTSLPGQALTITADGVNNATLLQTNLFATNGIIHIIDAVLVPVMNEDTDVTDDEMSDDTVEADAPTANIAELVINQTQADPSEFSILLQAIEVADAVILEALNGAGPLTVFAPTDAAFLAALDELGITDQELLANSDLVTAILQYHVIPGVFTAADFTLLANDDQRVPRIATLLPGLTLDIDLSTEFPQVLYAPIITPDVAASNGVVHIIEDVLIPPNLNLDPGQSDAEMTPEASDE